MIPESAEAASVVPPAESVGGMTLKKRSSVIRKACG